MEDMDMSPPPTMNEASSAVISISSKIMVATIIVLFFVVVFCFLISLYAKWHWSRDEDPFIVSWRRRTARQRQQAPAAPRKRGLDRATLRSLPVLVYDPKDFKEALECAVCLSEISEGEKARLLPKCNHGFHVECIDMWFKSHSTCPLCRNPVDSNENSLGNSEDNNNETSGHDNVSSSDSGSDSDLEDQSANNPAARPRELPSFPTNVLVWGNDFQFRTFGEPTNSTATSASASSSGVSRQKDELVIDIPRESCQNCPPSTQGGCEEEAKTPVVSRLRSLKRLLSRGKRVAFYGSSSADVEPV